MISIKEVISAKDIREFVDFQFALYKNEAFWVPPLKQDERKMLKKETNPASAFCDAKFWTAWKDGKCVGRVGAIINYNYNKRLGRKWGVFQELNLLTTLKFFLN